MGLDMEQQEVEVRIAARLDEQRSEELKRLHAFTRLRVEEILHRGIDLVV